MSYPGYASYTHPENGMAWDDMQAIQRVADRRNEVITFRSTGPWAKRWIENRYPTKGFHVKGKSSNWGPMAGLVPWEGRYSKVGHNAAMVVKGNAHNAAGLASGHAKRVHLTLTMTEIEMQLNRREELPPRSAISTISPVANSKDYFLFAERPGDGKRYPFRAGRLAGDVYRIFGYADHIPPDPRRLLYEEMIPLEVMTTTEVGTDKPMTGDYDLWAICPSFGQYGSTLRSDLTVPGARLKGGGVGQPQTFAAGVGMDNVLDPRLHTSGALDRQAPKGLDYHHRKAQYMSRLETLPPGPQRDVLVKQMQTLGMLDATGAAVKESPFREHADMGNLTPRILECITQMNSEMGVGKMGVLRRVHHNAESHRNRLFGAITGTEAEGGEGLPITIFQPGRMGGRTASAATGFDTIDTITTWGEFKLYARALASAGYYVPKNWAWGG